MTQTYRNIWWHRVDILDLRLHFYWVWVFTDGKLLFCHDISAQIKDKKFSMREYNNRTVYDCFNDIFTFYGHNPYFNLLPMPIDDSPRPKQNIPLYL